MFDYFKWCWGFNYKEVDRTAVDPATAKGIVKMLREEHKAPPGPTEANYEHLYEVAQAEKGQPATSAVARYNQKASEWRREFLQKKSEHGQELAEALAKGQRAKAGRRLVANLAALAIISLIIYGFLRTHGVEPKKLVVKEPPRASYTYVVRPDGTVGSVPTEEFNRAIRLAEAQKEQKREEKSFLPTSPIFWGSVIILVLILGFWSIVIRPILKK